MRSYAGTTHMQFYNYVLADIFSTACLSPMHADR